MESTTPPSSDGKRATEPPGRRDAVAGARPEPDLEEALFERDLARRIRGRLETEIRRLHHHINLVEADREALRQRLEERERYVSAIHASRGWRFLQWGRGLFGRRW